MNLPNKLTVSRFALTAAFLWAMFSRSPVNDTLALVFFSLAGITDYLDGKIARQRKLITNFGILMDPLADKIMTCSAFIALARAECLRGARLAGGGQVKGLPSQRRARAQQTIARGLSEYFESPQALLSARRRSSAASYCLGRNTLPSDATRSLRTA